MHFFTLGLASGFHQFEMDAVDILKTNFTVRSGRYEFICMLFWLKNATFTFQLGQFI